MSPHARTRRAALLLALAAAARAQFNNDNNFRHRSVASRVIAGIVVAIVVAILLVCLCGLSMRRRRAMHAAHSVPAYGAGNTGWRKYGGFAAPPPPAPGPGPAEHAYSAGAGSGFGQPGYGAPYAAGHTPHAPDAPPPAYGKGGNVCYPPPPGPPPMEVHSSYLAPEGPAPVQNQGTYAAPPGPPPPAHTTGQDSFIGGFRH